jgi:tetratricopeptide (TPR) repeat protein
MKNLIIFTFLFRFFLCAAQSETDIQLAQHYFTSGEFDKATSYYEKLYTSQSTKVYFTRYLECLMQIKDYKTAEKTIKKHISQNKNDKEIQVILGQFYEDIDEPQKSIKVYEDLLSSFSNDPGEIINLYQLFIGKGKFDIAKKVLDKGKKIASYYPFNFQYADLYSLTGNNRLMLEEYIDYLLIQPTMAETIQNAISSRVDLSQSDGKDYLILKEILLQKIQVDNSNFIYAEMLIWLFVQNKNFSAAFTQVVALDKRIQGDGLRVLDLGTICLENKSYAIARNCFNYVIALGIDNQYYIESQKLLLNSRFIELTTNRAYNQSEIDATLADYNVALTRLGKTKFTIGILNEQAHILAFYADRASEAIIILQDAILIQSLTDIQRAQLKMQLADIEVLKGDIWEASLLYMQIDKDFKFEAIGDEAKYKNARIFYFDGEFDFAQSQLNILKESTSKIIANDAMHLSVSITENFGLDSNYTAMTWFSSAELLIEQHKYLEAYTLFDSIQYNFPFHALADDILYRKAKAMEMQGKWTESCLLYEDILKFHPKDIFADDALFRLGDIYEQILLDKDKALEYYKKLAIDYKGSFYGAESIKRIRILRGDKNVEEDIY